MNKLSIRLRDAWLVLTGKAIAYRSNGSVSQIYFENSGGGGGAGEWPFVILPGATVTVEVGKGGGGGGMTEKTTIGGRSL